MNRATQEWLTLLAETQRSWRGCPVGFSPAQWLLDNGLRFPCWQPLPKGVRPGPARACYHNSLELARRKSGRYVYMEGYAAAIIPVQHAWCFDRETGLIVDRTWKDGTDYIGVAVKAGYAARCLRRGREVVMDGIGRYPIMTGEVPPEIWRETFKVEV